MTAAWKTALLFFQKPIPVWVAFLFLFLLEILYNSNIRHLGNTEILWISVLNVALYTTILIACLNIDLAKITIIYLAIPYLLFFPGWLNAPTATLMTGIFVYCTYQTLKQSSCRNSKISLTTRELFAFCLIIIWVNLSGSGGYGYQSPDYLMHNSRLNDLIEQSWPVHYGKDLNLVYYVGYYLPSAVIGKILGYTAATKSMFAWTLLGTTLALRWASLLSGWKLGAGLIVAFLFFGPMDATGLLWLAYKVQPHTFTIHEIITAITNNSDIVNFWASTYLKFFIGNFLSNTFQLYWAPQHIIPGWLCISLITHLFFEKKNQNILFVFCLLCLWSPLVMLAMSGFAITAILYNQPFKNREWITFTNIIGSTAITAVFLAFYIGGSALVNYSAWTLSAVDLSKNWDVIAVFYLSSWGVYAITLINHCRTYTERQKIWFTCLLATMLFLPLYVYGEYSDLLCRGSAPAMFLLMIFLLRFIKEKWDSNHRIYTIPLFIFMILGSTSAILQIYIGVTHYGENKAVIQVTEYNHATENLGSDNSFFARFFRGQIK